MANLILPAQTDLALALREPNLLVPGKQPVAAVRRREVNLALAYIGNDGFMDKIHGALTPDPAATLGIDKDGAYMYAEALGSYGAAYPSTVNTALQGASRLTFCALVKRSATIGANEQCILSNWNGSGNEHVLFRYDVSNGLELYLSNGTTGQLIAGSSAWLPAIGEVAFVAFRFDTGAVKIWSKNLSTAGTVAFSSLQAGSPVRPLTVGGEERGSADELNGYIYAAVLVKDALSDATVDAFRRDFYRQAFESANDTPYLISVPTGGATYTGTGSVASQSSAIAGTAEREITGTSALESQSSTIAGTGAIGGAITGTAVLAAQSSTIVGTGTRVITSAAELVSQASVIAGAAERAITGTSVIEAQSSSISGTGLVTEAGVVSGTGALDSQSSTISGTGILARTGTGTIATGVASIDAAGIITRVGTGTLAAQASSISGTGTASTPLTITGTGSLVCGVSSISGSQQTPVWTTIARVETVWTEI